MKTKKSIALAKDKRVDTDMDNSPGSDGSGVKSATLGEGERTEGVVCCWWGS